LRIFPKCKPGNSGAKPKAEVMANPHERGRKRYLDFTVEIRRSDETN
jgi:hypothetical protein